MCHGESQEEGQEESQEEVILLPYEDSARESGHCRFRGQQKTKYSAGMSKDTGKQAAARAALEFVTPGSVLGVGTGSTVNFLIDELASLGVKLAGAVSSSNGSTQRLEAAGYRVLDLNEAGEIDTYIDGADETNHQRQLIKGGGAALTREKIIAAASRRFICIADESKLVDVLGSFPLPVEVIPMARVHVSQALTRLGGQPKCVPAWSPTMAITSSTCTGSRFAIRCRWKAPSTRSSAWSRWDCLPPGLRTC